MTATSDALARLDEARLRWVATEAARRAGSAAEPADRDLWDGLARLAVAELQERWRVGAVRELLAQRRELVGVLGGVQ